MGVAPSRLWGRPILSAVRHGVTTTMPEWSPRDYALITLLAEWEDGLCPSCGDHLDSHSGRSADDYAPVWTVCPAVQALDIEQAAVAKADGDEYARPDPARSRAWTVLSTEQAQAWYEHLEGGG